MSDDRAAAFLEDILAEPATLDRLLDAYEAPGGPLAALPARFRSTPGPVVCVGLGSSRFAALDLTASLRASGIAAWTELAGTVTMPPAADLVVVAISASGRTPEVVEVVERHRRVSLVIAVTNDPEGPLATHADLVLPLLAGVERAGIASRTFQATNAVLALLADRLRGLPHGTASLRPAVAGLDTMLASRDTWLDPAVELLDRAPAIGVIAPGARLGLAEQGALMLREAPRLPASAHETGEWLHTAIYTALPGYRALLIAGSGSDAAVRRTIRGRSGMTLVVGSPGEPGEAELAVAIPRVVAGRPAAERLVLSTVPELLAASLWARLPLGLKEA